MKKQTIKRDFPYVNGKDYYVVGARSAWDTVLIGLYDTFNAALEDGNYKPRIIRKATLLEIENFFGLKEENKQ